MKKLPYNVSLTVISATLAVVFSVCGAAQAQAQTQIQTTLNLYSARHYDTDEALYTNFTVATGIKINRIEASDDALLERLRNEGEKSPADVVLMVDASRLFKAQNEGLFQPVQSAVLKAKVPAQYTASNNSWFGFSTRARVIVYNKASVKVTDVDAYEKLADAVNKGKVCTRSGTHPYNLSLFGAMVERIGTTKTEAVLKGMVANMARKPVGGDTDQIKTVASGECGVTIANTYYWARLLRSTKPEDQAIVAKVAMVWPNQTAPYASGSHVNVAGGAVAKYAPHKAAAVQFLEYLASPSAQSYFADGNNEWPIDATIKINNPALLSLGKFKAETVPASAFGLRQVTAARLMNQVGYK
jgi:iron(III) transport system substrate-binding protein